MATKKLSKTIIEGGRTGESKWTRRNSSKTERAAVRNALTACHNDPDIYDIVTLPKRTKAYKTFDDKLGVIDRFLESRIGKSWNKTYAMICEKFDTRTTAGRHIVFDHMLASIWLHQDQITERYRHYEYCLDKQGRLQKTKEGTPWFRLTKAERKQRIAENEKKQQVLMDWLDGRRIGKIGNVLYWWYTNDKKPADLKLDTWGDTVRYTHQYKDPLYKTMINDSWVACWQQGERLNGKDIEFFTRLEPRIKSALIKYAPKKTGRDPIFNVDEIR